MHSKFVQAHLVAERFLRLRSGARVRVHSEQLLQGQNTFRSPTAIPGLRRAHKEAQKLTPLLGLLRLVTGSGRLDP